MFGLGGLVAARLNHNTDGDQQQNPNGEGTEKSRDEDYDVVVLAAVNDEEQADAAYPFDTLNLQDDNHNNVGAHLQDYNIFTSTSTTPAFNLSPNRTPLLKNQSNMKVNVKATAAVHSRKLL
jgi:outer membrane receptor for monomeric catechols